MVSLCLIISSCAEDPQPREHLRGIVNSIVDTQIPEIDVNGATFKAIVHDFDPSEAISHGFLWGKNSTPDFSEFVLRSNFSNVLLQIEGEMKNTFSARVNTDLKPGDEYHFRNYVITANDTIMGNIEAFVSLGSSKPIINSVVPSSGRIGQTITITGENFALYRRAIFIRFGNNYGSVDPEIVNPNELKIRVPYSPIKGKVQMVLEIYDKEAVFDFTIRE